MSEQSKKEKTLERRRKIRAMVLIKTDCEIQKELHISRSTLAREKKIMRDEVQQWLDDIVGGDAHVYFKELLVGIMDRITKLKESFNNATSNEEQCFIGKGLLEHEKLFYTIFVDGPIFDLFKKRKKENEF